MLRRLLLLSLTVLIGIAGLSGHVFSRIAAAQDATPAAEPEVVIVDAVPEYFMIEVVDEVPVPPARMKLHRVSLDPDGMYRLFRLDDTISLVLVEAGEMTVTGDGAVTVTRDGPGGAREEIAAGTEFTASAGDYFAGSATSEITMSNATDEPLGLLVYRLDPAAEQSPFSPSVSSAYTDGDELTLATAVTEAIPPAPALLEMLRFTFAPGGYVELPETSPATALIAVESGEMTVTMSADTTVYHPTDGSPVPNEQAAGTEVTVEAGEFMIGQPYASVEARNEGDEPLVIYMAVIQPAPEPES